MKYAVVLLILACTPCLLHDRRGNEEQQLVHCAVALSALSSFMARAGLTGQYDLRAVLYSLWDAQEVGSGRQGLGREQKLGFL